MRVVLQRLSSFVLVSLVCAACGKTAGSGTADGSTPTTSKTTVDQSACTPVKLGMPDAKPLTLWKKPEGCAPKGGGSARATVKSEEELKAHFDCKAPSGIDFTKEALVVDRRMMSPAFAGNDVLDDGKQVTIVTKFRSSCPNEPPPMPAPYTLSFLVPAGAARTFGETNCKVESPCP